MAKRGNKTQMNLAELSRASALPARTIRYYIARGLLPPPLVGGRDACYVREHLERLARIRELQASGLTLSQIAWELGDKSGQMDLPQATAWWSYTITDDVVVHVRAQMPPWRLKRVRLLISQMAAELRSAETEDKSDAR